MSWPAIAGYEDLGKSNMTITRNLGDRRKYRSNRSNPLFGSTFNYYGWYSIANISRNWLVGPPGKEPNCHPMHEISSLPVRGTFSTVDRSDVAIDWIKQCPKREYKATSKSELAPNQEARPCRSVRRILTVNFNSSDGWDGERTRVTVTELPRNVGPALAADLEIISSRWPIVTFVGCGSGGWRVLGPAV